MAQQHINLGSTGNDGTGDKLRPAFTKIEDNFNELYATTASQGSDISNTNIAVANLANTVNAGSIGTGGFTFSADTMSLQTPDDITILSPDNANINIKTKGYAQFEWDGDHGAGIYLWVDSEGATIENVNGQQWKFNNDGNIVFPDSTIQSTAFTGNLYSISNLAFNTTNAVYTMANMNYMVTNAAYTLANSNYDVSNAAYSLANISFDTTNSAYTLANINFDTTNAVYTMANMNYTVTNAAYELANANFDTTNSAYGLVNAAFDVANSAFGSANDIAISANNYAGAMANSANSYTEDTYLKLTSTSQTITGDLTITGNIVFGGNATSITANNLVVDDSLIYLANNNPADILDIGFFGSYLNTSSVHVHTGLYRDHLSKQYYLFQGYDAEPDLVGNDITPYSNNMVNATLVADFVTSNLTLGGANAIVWVKSAYDEANNIAIAANNHAGMMANAVNAYANVVGNSGNAYTISVGASGNAYANVVGNSGNAYANVVGGASNTWANTVGASGNAYANVVGGASNTWANTVGASGNAWANSVGVTDRNYTNTSTSASNTWANTVGASGNAYTNTVSVSVNSYINLSTTSANNYAGAMANATNAYAVSVGASSNAWANSIGVTDRNYTNTSTAASNTWANTVGAASNVYTVSVGASGNAYANLVGTSVNSYINVSTTAANNYAGVMANAANAYAASISGTTLTANAVSAAPTLTVVVPTSGVNVNTEIVTATSHGFVTGDPVVYNANGGTVLGGLTDGGVYYINAINANTFYLYDNLNNALAGGATGRKNLTSTGNNLQSFTSASISITYNLTTGSRVFVHTLPNELISISSNFTVTLSNNQATKVTLIFPPAIGSDCDFVATKVNGVTVTGETLTNGIKRNNNTYLNFTIVKIAGVHTIYNV